MLVFGRGMAERGWKFRESIEIREKTGMLLFL